MKKLLSHWLNPAPSPNMSYITDRYEEKFWLDWIEDGNLNQLYVSYRGRSVGRVNLLFEDDGGTTLTDLIIFPPIRKRDPILRNRGLGKAMLQETVRHERQKTVAYIWGWIQPDEFTSMEYLIEWYKRQGFMVDKNDRPTIYLELCEEKMTPLVEQFHHAMIGVADFANAHKFGIRFRQMIQEWGAVEAAKRLLAKQEIQSGLMELWELGALRNSMEALVVQERFHELFTEQEIAEARRRLNELEYFSK